MSWGAAIGFSRVTVDTIRNEKRCRKGRHKEKRKSESMKRSERTGRSRKKLGKEKAIGISVTRV
jgi:hypothetical protein